MDLQLLRNQNTERKNRWRLPTAADSLLSMRKIQDVALALSCVEGVNNVFSNQSGISELPETLTGCMEAQKVLWGLKPHLTFDQHGDNDCMEILKTDSRHMCRTCLENIMF